jgi:MoaA/NifB/PqqE/SkfB family radical SAM enzyme
MILLITETCNLNCLFCSAKGRNAKINRKTILQQINQCKDGLTISGGEPTLSPDLFWIIEEAKKKNLFVELQTNGITLCYKGLVSKLVKAGVNLFNINFPSHLSLINDKITQTKGLFKNKIEGIKNLQAVGSNIRLTCVVNALNYKDLQDYVIFVKQNFPKIKFLQFSFIKIMGQARKNPQILITYEKVQPFLLRAFKKCQELNIDFITDHIPLCYLDNLVKYHIDYQKIIRGEKPEYSLKEKMKLKECADCRLNSFCYGVRKDYLEFFGKKTKVKPLKNL